MKPALGLQNITRNADLFTVKRSFSIIPSIRSLDRFVPGLRTFARAHPMNGGEKLHAEGRLKSMNQVGDTLEPSLRLWKCFDQRRSRFGGSWKKFNRPLRIVLCIAVAADEMSLNDVQHRAQ